MKNKNKKKTIILLCIWVVLLILIPFITLKLEDSLSSNTRSYISSEFEVEDYNVVLDVDKDNKVCGDCDYESLVGIANYVTPVPKGVGNITTLIAFLRVLERAS